MSDNGNGINGRPKTWRELETAFRIRCKNKQPSEATCNLYTYRTGLFIDWLVKNDVPFVDVTDEDGEIREGISEWTIQTYLQTLTYQKGERPERQASIPWCNLRPRAHNQMPAHICTSNENSS